MANKIENFLANNRLDPIDAMNRLQSAGIVADNCVHAADVAKVDAERAVAWLLKNQLAIAPG